MGFNKKRKGRGGILVEETARTKLQRLKRGDWSKKTGRRKKDEMKEEGG